MSLLFNMLFRLVITFLSRSKCLLISWLQSSSPEILEPKKIKSVTVSIVFPSICHEVMGPNAMVLVFWILRFFFSFFWMLSFKPASLLFSFTFIKRLFSSCFLFAITVVSVICISEVIDISPGNLDSSLCFIQLGISCDVLCIEVKYAGWQYTTVTYPFPNLEPVCFRSRVASWPAYRFLRRQVMWSGIPISWRIFQFVVIHTVKGFGKSIMQK